jgi:hypothetical protein
MQRTDPNFVPPGIGVIRPVGGRGALQEIKLYQQGELPINPKTMQLINRMHEDNPVRQQVINKVSVNILIPSGYEKGQPLLDRVHEVKWTVATVRKKDRVMYQLMTAQERKNLISLLFPGEIDHRSGFMVTTRNRSDFNICIWYSRECGKLLCMRSDSLRIGEQMYAYSRSICAFYHFSGDSAAMMINIVTPSMFSSGDKKPRATKQGVFLSEKTKLRVFGVVAFTEKGSKNTQERNNTIRTNRTNMTNGRGRGRGNGRGTIRPRNGTNTNTPRSTTTNGRGRGNGRLSNGRGGQNGGLLGVSKRRL